jgi:hypothetical protein
VEIAAPTTYSSIVNIVPGTHTIRIEHYENTGGSQMKVSIEKAANKLKNPTFTSNLDGWDWHKSANYVYHTTSQGRSSPGAMCMKNGKTLSSGWATEAYQGEFRFKRNQVYKITGWAKKISGTIDKTWVSSTETNYGGARIGGDQKLVDTTTYLPIDEHRSSPAIDTLYWKYTEATVLIDDKGSVWRDGKLQTVTVPPEIDLTVWLDIYPFTGDSVVCWDDVALYA